MPNHCMNYLDVTGQYKDVLKFILETHGIDKNDGEPHYKLLFEKISPTPIKEDGDIIEEWYDWRLKNWGCKWDCYDEFGSLNINEKTINVDSSKFNPIYLNEGVINREDEAEYSIGFCTAWAPPIAIYNSIAERYKDLDLKIKVQYDEGGCAFAGHILYHKGEVLEDVYVDVSNNAVEYYEYLIEHEIEDMDYLLENIFNSLLEKHEDELSNEYIIKLYEKVKDIMESEDATIKQKAKLYVDICLDVKEEPKQIEEK